MSLILPPRFENRDAEQTDMLRQMSLQIPEIPIYEADQFDSLRPTWLPVDPSTFRPPPRRSRGSKLAAAGKIAVLLAATWGLAFAAVVAPPLTRDYLAQRSAASHAAPEIAATSTTSTMPAVVFQTSTPSNATPKSANSAVTLTVDVMSLPVSKNVPARNRKPRSRS
jgi:hypothetical protein